MDELYDQESEFLRMLGQVPCDDQGRPEHRDAVRARTLGAFDAAGRGTAPMVPDTVFIQGRELMRHPLSRLILTVAACLAVVAVWWLIPGQQSTAHAFNRFAEALVDARSATFQMEVKIEGQGKQKLESFYLAPGRLRNEMKEEMISIVDMSTGQIATLMPQKKAAIVMKMQNIPKDGKPQFNDFFERMRDLLAKTREKAEDFERLGEKEIDGHRAIGFRLASPLQTMTLWGDPATGLPVLVETVWSGVPRTEVTMSRFALNADLKPELFDTTPPADYKTQTVEIDASKPTEATLIEALRLASELNDGLFVNNLDAASTQGLIHKQMIRDMKEQLKDKPEDPNERLTSELMKTAMIVGRGMMFALELPPSADAHYAGKGVKRGEPDRPIFWYKPDGGKTYRVIYADLRAKAAEQAPTVANAVKLGAPRAAEEKKSD